MLSAHCPICLDDFPLVADKFEMVIYPCGHGYCTDCSNRLFTQAKAMCPTCRVILDRKKGHPIYLEFNQSSAMGVTDAIQVLEQKFKGGQRGNDRLSTLLQPIQDFQASIVLLFSNVESQKRENEALRNEIGRLGLSLEEANKNTDEAIRLLEITRNDLRKAHEISSRWQKRAAELEEDNKRCEDQLEWHINNVRLQKKKSKKFVKLLHKLAELEEVEPTSGPSDGISTKLKLVCMTPPNFHSNPQSNGPVWRHWNPLGNTKCRCQTSDGHCAEAFCALHTSLISWTGNRFHVLADDSD